MQIDHHYYFNCNYGQFFTLWDRIGGSFKNPSAFDNEDPKSTLYKSIERVNDESKNK
jgi:lathosterol oxidase